jgi:outer membrane protein with beta-barrel domain
MRAYLKWWIILAVLAMPAVSPLRAQGYLGVSAGLYSPEDSDQDRTESFGIRGGYRFLPNFGFEANLSRVDLDDTIPPEEDPGFPLFDFDFQVDLTTLDVSLQWFPGGRNFVIYGGPGMARLESDVRGEFFGFPFSESDTSDVFTAHAGAAYEWHVTNRFLVRPELRIRHYFDDDVDPESEGLAVSYKSTDYEANLVFAWRFGA